MVAARRWAYELEQRMAQPAAEDAGSNWDTTRFDSAFKAAARQMSRQSLPPGPTVHRALLKLEAMWRAHLAHVAPHLRHQDMDMTEVSLAWKEGEGEGDLSSEPTYLFVLRCAQLLLVLNTVGQQLEPAAETAGPESSAPLQARGDSGRPAWNMRHHLTGA